MRSTVAVINGKGGVGKTTVTANLAGLLAHSGLKVLAVDMDPQGNLGIDLTYRDTEQDDDGESLAAALLFGYGGTPIQNIRPNLDALVGGSHLKKAAASLVSTARDEAHKALRKVLEPIQDTYDVILIDCPPGIEPLQDAAVAAARWLVMPARVDSASSSGLIEIAGRMDAVEETNPGVELLGIVLFGVAVGETRVKAEMRQLLADTIGADPRVFDTAIRHSNAVAQALRRTGGGLVHEVEVSQADAPAWWEIRKGTAADDGVSRPKTTASVADDFQALAAEFVTRLYSEEGAA